MILPPQRLFDTVRTTFTVKRSWWRSLFCAHLKTTHFLRIDHRAGPGSYADNFEGRACCDCGKILEEEKTS